MPVDLTEQETTLKPQAPTSPSRSATSDAGHHGNKDAGDGKADDAKKHLSKRQIRAEHESKVRTFVMRLRLRYD